MLIDDVTIRLSGGQGGDGVVGFSRIKDMHGPTGGNGGPGGDVYLEGIRDIAAFQQFKFTKEFAAEDGKPGTTRLRDGERGNDLVLKVPVGTVAHNLDTGETQEITKEGDRILAAHGGFRGRGNFHHRAGSNTTPMESEDGKPGESFEFRLELKMIADVGLIGLPNAGKSSLLNALTSAKSKIGNYAFTTLEPHLGAYYGLILADIPGLIEGASAGKGLGTKFLRHIERTRALFHLVSCENEDVVSAYKTVRAELEAYNPEFIEKKEVVFLSKADMCDEQGLAKKIKELGKAGVKAQTLSVIDDESVKNVRTLLNGVQSEL